MLGYLLLVILIASALGYLFNYYSARRLTASGEKLHSLAGFHGVYAICLTGLPAFIFVLLWLVFQESVIEAIVAGGLPEAELAGMDEGQKALLMAEIRSAAQGNVFGEPKPFVMAAAESLNNLRATAWMALSVCVVAILGLGMFLARRKISAAFRARQVFRPGAYHRVPVRS